MCDGKVTTQQLQTSAIISAETKDSFSQQFQQNPKTDIYSFIGSHAHPRANYCDPGNVVLPSSEDTLN